MFSKRLKRVFYILAFFTLVLLGDHLIAKPIDQLVLKSKFRFSTLYHGGQSSEIVVLGNSRGVNAIYAPALEKATGLSVFNLSYNGMSMQLSEVLFQDYIEHNSVLKLLILEITNIFSTDDLIKDLKLYSHFSSRIQKITEKLQPQVAFASKISNLFSFNGEMFFRTLYYLNKSDQSWINRSQINPNLLKLVKTSNSEEVKIIPENLNALVRIVNLAKKKGVTVRLLISPYLPAYADKISNLSHQIAIIEKTVTMQNKIWNYSKVIQQVEAFADRVHLNQNGSMLLMEQLRKAGFFII